MRKSIYGFVFSTLFLASILFSQIAYAQPKVYWTDITPGPKVQRSNLDGTGLETIIEPLDLLWNSTLPWMEGLAIDSQAGKIYWIGDYSPGGRIGRADLDGSNQEILVEAGLSSPRDVILHHEEAKMYWTMEGKIQRANFDGSGVEDVVDLEGRFPHGLAINPINRKIYWTDSDWTIKRANLDGSGIESIVALIGPYNWPLAIDPLGGKIYWIDTEIKRANMDGTGVEVLCDAGSASIGLAINYAEQKMYWGGVGESDLWKADLDGSNVEVVHSSAPASIAFAFDNQRGAISLPLSTPLSLLFLSLLLGVVGLSFFADAGALSLKRTSRYNRPRQQR